MPHSRQNRAIPSVYSPAALDLLYFEDLPLGEQWTSRRRTLTDADLALYRGVAGDFNPLSADLEHAAASELGVAIPAPLVTAVALGLGSLDAPVPATVALVGMTWKYVKPIRPGQPLQARWRLNRKRDVENPRWGLATWQVDVLGEDGEVFAAGEVSRLVERRTQLGAAGPDGSAASDGTGTSRRRRRRRSGSAAAAEPAAVSTPDVPEPAPADVPAPSRRRRRRRSSGSGNGGNGNHGGGGAAAASEPAPKPEVAAGVAPEPAPKPGVAAGAAPEPAPKPEVAAGAATEPAPKPGVAAGAAPEPAPKPGVAAGAAPEPAPKPGVAAGAAPEPAPKPEVAAGAATEPEGIGRVLRRIRRR